jgi:hypothetical protein
MSASTPDEDAEESKEGGGNGAGGTEAERADAEGTDDGVSADNYLTASLLVLLVGAVVSATGVGGPSPSGPLFVPDWTFGVLAAVIMAAGIARAELAG